MGDAMTPQHSQPTPVTANRRYPSAPMVGTAVVVLDDEGRVLLVQRGKPPRVGAWGIPGGLLDLGERLVDGARREVREECGVEIELRDLIAAFEPMYYDEEGRLEYHYVVLDYWGTLAGGTARPGDDAAAVAWATMDELPNYNLRAETTSVVTEAYRRWRELK
jgi:ADP-ribose pyrophosphatase YjhB (NUDIX family)